MAKNSNIQWTDHTCNFWWGCTKVSPACHNCYAETMSKRVGRDCFGMSPRYRTKGPWKDILKWDKSAGERGVRERVFVNSMSDIGEQFNELLEEWRKEAFDILAGLENLDVLLLTKRPRYLGFCINDHFSKTIPKHFWVGATAENQEMFDARIPWLLEIFAHHTFISIEPMLGPVDVSDYIHDIDWVIAGSESGPHMRTSKEWWFRSLRDQCAEYRVPFFLKQMHVDKRIDSYRHKVELIKEPLLDGVRHLETPFDHNGGDDNA